MKLSKVQRDIRPKRTVVLSPDAFADDWPGKPAVDVCIGLRFVAQADFDRARREAEREGAGFYASLRGTPIPTDMQVSVDVYNDTFIMRLVALGTCDPNNVTAPYFRAAEDTVPNALTPEGARRVYDELVLLHKGSAPARRQATDEEVERFAMIAVAAESLDAEDRRLIAYLIEKREAEEDVHLPDGYDDDPDSESAESVYVAKLG